LKIQQIALFEDVKEGITNHEEPIPVLQRSQMEKKLLTDSSLP
jgi:hypothetical protein